MTYDQIQAFLAIVQERSISKAADKLFVSQSTVSYRLTSLENELNTSLIVRSKGFRTIELTAAGERFIFIAQRWQILWEETSKLQIESGSVLQIGGADSICNFFLRPFFMEFIDAFSNIQLSINTMVSMHTYSQLESREIDVGFVTIAAWNKNILLTPILNESYQLLCYDPELQLPETLHPSALDPLQELFQPWGPEYQQWHDYWWPQPGRQALCIYTTTLIESYLCRAGRWTVVPDCIAAYFAGHNGIRCIHLSEPPQNRISYLAIHKYPRRQQEDAIRTFQSFLTRYLARGSTAAT